MKRLMHDSFHMFYIYMFNLFMRYYQDASPYKGNDKA